VVRDVSENSRTLCEPTGNLCLFYSSLRQRLQIESYTREMVPRIQLCCFALMIILYGVISSCPNHCNSHGTCDKFGRLEACLLEAESPSLFSEGFECSGALVTLNIKERTARKEYARLGWPGRMRRPPSTPHTPRLSAQTEDYVTERQVPIISVIPFLFPSSLNQSYVLSWRPFLFLRALPVHDGVLRLVLRAPGLPRCVQPEGSLPVHERFRRPDKVFSDPNSLPFRCGNIVTVPHTAVIFYIGNRNEKSELFTYTTRWDSDKIKGCQCDYPATGYDCSQQLCPNGDDPLTPGQVSVRPARTIFTSCNKFNDIPSN
jgi:hypothetical protein